MSMFCQNPNALYEVVIPVFVAVVVVVVVALLLLALFCFCFAVIAGVVVVVLLFVVFFPGFSYSIPIRYNSMIIQSRVRLFVCQCFPACT